MQIKKFKADIESFKGYQEINHNDDIDSVLESELGNLQQEEIRRKQLEEEKLNMDFIEELKKQNARISYFPGSGIICCNGICECIFSGKGF